MAITTTAYNYPDCNTYNVNFFGDNILTTVTHDPNRVSHWISEVNVSRYTPSLVVGLDAEWRPSYGPQRNPIAVLQLCSGRRCLVYQIHLSPYIPQSLVDFLSRSCNVFVGVGIKQDLDKLQNDYGIGGNVRYMDLGDLAAREYGRNDLRNAGLKALASHVLGKEVEKPLAVTRSAWDNRLLTAEQVQYACVDAFLSSEIGRTLNASYY